LLKLSIFTFKILFRGDPEKCDHYGNTALHFASARGHMNCVTFLMNYGVNLYAKDIDYHTAKELAAMNDRQEILRYLDEQDARQQRNDPKKAKAQIEKATKETDKLVKDFAQVQEKARKLAEKEKKRLEKEREEMERSGMIEPQSFEPGTLIPRPSVAALDLRRDSRLIYSSPKYSDIVNPKEEKDKIKLPVSAVYKKVQQQRKKMMSSSTSQNSTMSKNTIMTATNNNNGEQVTSEPGDFKIGAVEDGKRSVRSISGLRRDSEIMYVPKYDDSNGKSISVMTKSLIIIIKFDFIQENAPVWIASSLIKITGTKVFHQEVLVCILTTPRLRTVATAMIPHINSIDRPFLNDLHLVD
jgi:hypothetical protein